MKPARSLILLSGLLLVGPMAALASEPTAIPSLDKGSFEQWRDYIVPTAQEMQWQEIPWHESFWKGLLEAQEQNKPLLLWTMNGHPLGCT